MKISSSIEYRMYTFNKVIVYYHIHKSIAYLYMLIDINLLHL